MCLWHIDVSGVAYWCEWCVCLWHIGVSGVCVPVVSGDMCAHVDVWHIWVVVCDGA